MFGKSRIVKINNIELKESVILLKAHAAFLHLFPYYLLIFEIVKFPKSGYKIRKINQKDVKLIYDWTNDPLVRSQSFNSESINYSDHQKWFESKLNNPKALLLINEYEGSPIGIVRFE